MLPNGGLIPKPGETLAETAATFGPEDVLVLLALRRVPKLADAVTGAALDAGTHIAVLGDVPELETMPVRWRIACATTSDGPLLNHASVLAVCNLVAARTLELSGPAGRRRMGRIEDIHDRLGEL